MKNRIAEDMDAITVLMRCGTSIRLSGMPVLCAMLFLFCGVFEVTAHAGATGPAIKVNRLPGDGGAFVEFDFYGPVEVESFYLEAPARFVVDVAGAVLSGNDKVVELNSRLIYRVRVAQNRRNPDVVRIVFDLKKNEKIVMDVNSYSGRIIAGEQAARQFPAMVVSRHADRYEIRFGFGGEPNFESSSIGKPHRLVLDFAGYVPQGGFEEKIIDDGILRSVRVSHFTSAPDVTRVVVETKFDAKIEMSSEPDGGDFVITVYQSSLYGKVIAVDPGHGGKDPGAMGLGIMEKEIALDIALKLRGFLEMAGAQVVMTRTVDRYVSLGERARIANDAGAELFVSIHANALDGHEKYPDLRGVQVLYYSSGGRDFARVMQDELSDALGIGHRGIFMRKDLVVLRKTRMKAVLVETGFMTHKKELELLKKDIFRENAARGLFNGLEKLCGSRGTAIATLGLPPDMYSLLPACPEG